jgi:hypothetical protein
MNFFARNLFYAACVIGAIVSPDPCAAQSLAAKRDLRPFMYLPFVRSNLPGDLVNVYGESDYTSPRLGPRRDFLRGVELPRDYVAGLVLRPSGFPNTPDTPDTRKAPLGAYTFGLTQGGDMAAWRPTPGMVVEILNAATANIRVTFGTPTVRTTLDGSRYEAVSVMQHRGDSLWETYHYGYRMGLVAAKTNESAPFADRNDFDLSSLPEPIVEGAVTEYLYRPVVPNSSWGHYFYASNELERAALDENEDWMRTGRDFKSGGYLPVCRFFYRPPNGGAATHFYTAKTDECERFKSTPGFTYEGTPFRASLPRPLAANGQAADDPARCPEKTVPLWRYFNQPSNSAVAPNHRYVLNRGIGNRMTSVERSNTGPWADEGIALCVPTS